MSSNFISSAEIERQRREEIRKQQEEISMSNAFNLKLNNIVENSKQKYHTLLNDSKTSNRTYIKTLLNDKYVNEIKELCKLEIREFNLSSQELKSNRIIAESTLQNILDTYNKEYSIIIKEIDENAIETEEYNEISKTIQSIQSSLLYFYDVNLDDYKNINVKKQKIIDEIECMLNQNTILLDDKRYLESTLELLNNLDNEHDLLRCIKTYAEDRRQILRGILELNDKYYQYVVLNKELNSLTKRCNKLLDILEFNSINEIENRISNLICNICDIKENEYIFESIIKVCKMHGFNIIDNDSYNNEKAKLLHKDKNKTALKIVNNQKMYNFEILSLKNGNNENGISRDISNNIDETMKDRIAFCNIHPELVKDLDKIFGIKLNVCRHTENPNDDPYNKIEVNEDIYEKLVEMEKLNEEQKAKYENM